MHGSFARFAESTPMCFRPESATPGPSAQHDRLIFNSDAFLIILYNIPKLENGESCTWYRSSNKNEQYYKLEIIPK